jgi:hypothetical protein
MDIRNILAKLDTLNEGTMAAVKKHSRGPKFPGYWKGTDAADKSKSKMVGAAESVLKDLEKELVEGSVKRNLEEEFAAFKEESDNPRIDLTPNYPNYATLVGEFVGMKGTRARFKIINAAVKSGQGETEKIAMAVASGKPILVDFSRIKNRAVLEDDDMFADGSKRKVMQAVTKELEQMHAHSATYPDNPYFAEAIEKINRWLPKLHTNFNSGLKDLLVNQHSSSGRWAAGILDALEDLGISRRDVMELSRSKFMQENDDSFAPSQRAATSIATRGWRRGGERTGSYQGSVTTTFDHIKSAIGDPISGPTDDPYDKVSCEWILTFKDGVVASIYDYKTGGTPMGEYAWHIGGNNKKAVEYVSHLLGIKPEVTEGSDDMFADRQSQKIGGAIIKAGKGAIADAPISWEGDEDMIEFTIGDGNDMIKIGKTYIEQGMAAGNRAFWEVDTAVRDQMYDAVLDVGIDMNDILDDLDEGVDIGQEWMSDTELDQYIPANLQQQWSELLGYDRNGNPSALWANLTGGYEPDVNDPEHRALMVKVANKWFAAKKIPNVQFYNVKDADDELEWLVQIGPQGVAEATRKPAAPQFTKYTNYELWERERYARGANYSETEIDGRLVGVAVVGTTYNEWGYVRDTGKVVGMWYNKASIGSFVQDGTSFDDSLSYAEQDTTWPYMNESQGAAEGTMVEGDYDKAYNLGKTHALRGERKSSPWPKEYPHDLHHKAYMMGYKDHAQRTPKTPKQGVAEEMTPAGEFLNKQERLKAGDKVYYKGRVVGIATGDMDDDRVVFKPVPGYGTNPNFASLPIGLIGLREHHEFTDLELAIMEGGHSLDEARIHHPGRINVYFKPNQHGEHSRVVAQNIPSSTLDALIGAMVKKFGVSPSDFSWQSVDDPFGQRLNEYGMTTGGMAGMNATAPADPAANKAATAQQLSNVQANANKLKAAGVNLPAGTGAVAQSAITASKNPNANAVTGQGMDATGKKITGALGQEMEKLLTTGNPAQVQQVANAIKQAKMGQK